MSFPLYRGGFSVASLCTQTSQWQWKGRVARLSLGGAVHSQRLRLSKFGKNKNSARLQLMHVIQIVLFATEVRKTEMNKAAEVVYISHLTT